MVLMNLYARAGIDTDIENRLGDTEQGRRRWDELRE